MFGTKLRSWMEAHIVRPRRKQPRLNKDNTETTTQQHHQHTNNTTRKGTLHDDTNRQQNHSSSTTNHHQPGAISASTTGSSLQRDASGSSLQRQTSQQSQVTAAAGTGAGAGLSSPESAYSTGYSTDGTSPGAAPPPEYYINIRTGTHYFQHAANVGPAVAKVGQAHAKALEAVRAAVKAPETVQHKHRRAESCCPPLLPGAAGPFVRAPLQPALKDPVQLLVTPAAAVPSRLSDPAPVPALIVQSPPALTAAATASPSPRQRSRIRTNPWMSGSVSRSNSVVNCGNTINTTTSGSTCSSSGVGATAAGNDSCRLSSSSSSCTAPSGSAAESGGEMAPTAPTASMTSTKFPCVSPAAVSSRLQSPRVSRPGRSPRKNCRTSGGNQGKQPSPLVKRSVSVCSSSSTSTDDDITPKGRPVPGYPAQYVINNVIRPRSDVDDEDEDVTLNEMMGKYDESYVYEKETDILSDSDPTDCELDLIGGVDGADTDTGGEEAGDEDTALDEMDYIDAECSVASLENKHANTGRCTYHQIVPPSMQLDAAARRRECYLRRSARRRSAKQSEQRARRSKRQRDGSKNRQDTVANVHAEGSRRSSRPAHRSDSGSRSLGGTPLSLRRQKAAAAGERKRDPSKLAAAEIRVKKRSNSVSFAEGVRGALRCGQLVSCDSETAIMEADKEADQKYKELILEAENILVSMKSATPSPRHRPIMTPMIPANKRVEHLRTTETDLVFLKNRVEDGTSVPNSPKTTRASPRFSPKKNHITNFINSNSPELSRRESSSINDSPLRRLVTTANVIVNRATSPVPICPQSPTVVRKTYTNRVDHDKSQMKLNGRVMTQSPKHRNGSFTSTTIHSQMHVLRIDDDSDSCENDLRIDDEINNSDVKITLHKTISEKLRVGFERINGNASINGNRILDSSSSESDGKQNLVKFRNGSNINNNNTKAPLMTFRSVDMGYSIQDTSYCPQSEPVKRKVYSCSATYDKLQKSLERPEETNAQLSDDENFINDDAEGGLCRTSLRVKVAQLRRERLAAEASAIGNNDSSTNLQQQISQFRRQILLHTLEGLKRSLEDQSASLQQTYRDPKENEKIDAAN